MTPRERLLLDAAAAVRERGESYGDPQTHFARTVGAINAVFAHKLREPLTPADWGIIMVLDKCAREQHAPKRDNMTDVAGYAACVAEIRSETEAFNESWAARAAQTVRKQTERLQQAVAASEPGIVVQGAETARTISGQWDRARREQGGEMERDA